MNKKWLASRGGDAICWRGTTEEIVRAMLRKIRYQFPKTPEGQFVYSIVELAIIDCVRKISFKAMSEPMTQNQRKKQLQNLGTAKETFADSLSAWEYLNRPTIPHAAIGGVDSDWVRDQFKRAGIDLSVKPVNPL